MEHHRRHVLFWKLARFIAAPWLRRKFNFTPQIADVKGPYLVLANHTTDWDPLLVACSFPEQMYFVASEHIFRWRFTARLIRWLVDPIARLKSRTAADTAMAIIRRLRGGANVCLFAEGNRSWNGVTCPIHPSTGRLARSCGATLVTYRLEGGYFTNPRWSHSKLRRGRMRGYVVGVYTRETLLAMTPEEIGELIVRDLHENACERQRVERVAYKGRNLAQHLETLLCVCPDCGRLDSLKSAGDYLRCECGLLLRFTEYGEFEGERVPFDNILDWDLWQTERLRALWNGAGSERIFSDDEIHLWEILPGYQSRDFGVGRLSLYRDRLQWNDMVFPLSEISDINMLENIIMIVGIGQRSFQLECPQTRCIKKYMTLFELAKSREQAAV